MTGWGVHKRYTFLACEEGSESGALGGARRLGLGY